MNRAFLIVIAPGVLVALLYLGFGWDFHVSLWLGLAVLGVALGAFLWSRKRKRAAEVSLERNP